MIKPTTEVMAYGAGALILVLCVLLGVQTVRLAGANEALATERAAHLKTQRDDAKKLADSIESARTTEKGLRSSMDELQAKAAQEKEDAQAREDALVESVRTGHRRLSVLAQCPSAPSAGRSASAPGGGGPTVQRAELDPAFGVSVLDVGRDADRNTRERNICVEAYEQVRARLNALNLRLSGAGQ